MALFSPRMIAGPTASESLGCFNADSWALLKDIQNHRFYRGPEIYFKPLSLLILSSLKFREPWLRVLQG